MGSPMDKQLAAVEQFQPLSQVLLYALAFPGMETADQSSNNDTVSWTLQSQA